MWKLIQQRAEEKDISYVQASGDVVPEYVNTIRHKDMEFEEAAIKKRQDELNALAEFEHARRGG